MNSQGVRRVLAAVFVLVLGGATGAAGQTLADYDYENLSFRGVGLDYGYLWPNKVEAAPAYSVRVDLGYLGPGVRLIPSLTYWSSTLKESELQRLADQFNGLGSGRTVSAADFGTIEWSNASLGVDGQYVWAVPFNLFPYLGVGLGIHVMNGSGDAVDGTFVEDLLDTVTASGAASAGIEVAPTEMLRLYGEARYTLLSDIRYPGLRLGAAFLLPQGSD